MLLDSFMGGFLHQLFLQKWELFARRGYVYHLLANMFYVLLLNVTVFLSIFCSEQASCVVDASVNRGLCYALLTAMALSFVEDIRSSCLCWVNYAGAEGNRVGRRTRFVKLLRWMNYHGFLFGIVSCSHHLGFRLPSRIPLYTATEFRRAPSPL